MSAVSGPGTSAFTAGGPGWGGELGGWSEGTVHAYLSCACLHGFHDECGRLQGERGDLAPPHCKFCPAVCLCPVCKHGVLPLVVRARAFHRGFRNAADGRAVRVRRLHILREDTRFPKPSGWCGTAAQDGAFSVPVILDPMPATPPPGLSWCTGCIGSLAEQAGLIDGLAVLLATVGTVR